MIESLQKSVKGCTLNMFFTLIPYIVWIKIRTEKY